MTAESLISIEAEMLRQQGFAEHVGSTKKRDIGNFYTNILESFYYEEVDQTEVAFFFDLLPVRSLIKVYPNKGQTLRVDHYSDEWVPCSTYENDWTRCVLSAYLDYGNREERQEQIDIDSNLNTVWLNSGGWSLSDGVELNFDGHGLPNFRLMIEVPEAS